MTAENEAFRSIYNCSPKGAAAEVFQGISRSEADATRPWWIASASVIVASNHVCTDVAWMRSEDSPDAGKDLIAVHFTSSYFGTGDSAS